MMPVDIRPITPADAAGYNRALDSVAREQKFLRLTRAPSLDSSKDFIADNISGANPHFVAVDEDVVVGWCDICRSDAARSEHVGELGMGLIATHRSRGIGPLLLEATLAAARPHFRRVELQVYETNLAAIRLYEKAGFTHEGRRRRAIHLDGLDRDILIMAMLFE